MNTTFPVLKAKACIGNTALPAPAEERRTLAVMNRRFLDAEMAADLGRLDSAAIERVREEAWPQVENADELHDALMQLGIVTAAEGKENGWEQLFEKLVADRRASVLTPAQVNNLRPGDLWIAAERLKQLRAIHPLASLSPQIDPPSCYANESWMFEDALVEILRGRIDGLGPVTVAELAASFSLTANQIEAALIKLESEGFAMQGRFTPEAGKDAGGLPAGMPALPALQEWCSRRLLARIHSYTLNRLRKEIEPVSASDFLRFLFVWHKVAPDHRVEGPESVAVIIDQLEGFEAPAGSWESEILPARVADYDPAWLDALCLSGKLTWLRLSPPRLSPEKVNSSAPVRSTPIVLLNRRNVQTWSKGFFATGSESNGGQLSTNTAAVYEYMKDHGASFFVDIVAGTNLLPSMVEEGLGELVFRGLVSADSFTGLRALITPLSKTTHREIEKLRRKRKQFYSMDDAGRWVRLREERGQAPFLSERNGDSRAQPVDRETIEVIARKLLQRYGVVFRKILDREAITVPWRDLLRVYRRLEARGEIRGGRFVGGFSGEQFASTEAVQLLRSIRRAPAEGTMISLSAADPLNLQGIITPGSRLPQSATNRVLYRDGVPVAVLEAKEVRYLVEMSIADQWQARNALLRRYVPPQVRTYLNQSGNALSPQSLSRLTH
jgi:ATP-dependent Lhr-like helicase